MVLVGAVTLQEENNNLAEGDDVSRVISSSAYTSLPRGVIYLLFFAVRAFSKRVGRVRFLMRAGRTRFLRFSEKGKKKQSDKGLSTKKKKRSLD